MPKETELREINVNKIDLPRTYNKFPFFVGIDQSSVFKFDNSFVERIISDISRLKALANVRDFSNISSAMIESLNRASLNFLVSKQFENSSINRSKDLGKTNEDNENNTNLGNQKLKDILIIKIAKDMVDNAKKASVRYPAFFAKAEMPILNHHLIDQLPTDLVELIYSHIEKNYSDIPENLKSSFLKFLAKNDNITNESMQLK